ncbi:hypothetical protein D6789_02660 [Candidatus Woesearchaeota archaeon]|nr:MAG: hypothetical protein D6789_02660 [Candidatus Woesearchaeota archaeon]
MRKLLSKSLASLLLFSAPVQAQEVTKQPEFYQRIYSGETSRIEYFLFEGENEQMQLPVKNLAALNKEFEELFTTGGYVDMPPPETQEQIVPHVLFLEYIVVNKKLYDTREWGTSIEQNDTFLAFATNLSADAYDRLREATIQEASNINAPAFSPRNMGYDWPLFAVMKDELIAHGKPGSYITVFIPANLGNMRQEPVLQLLLLNDEEMKEDTGEEPPFTPKQRLRRVAIAPFNPQAYIDAFQTTEIALMKRTRPTLFESQTVLHNVKKQTIDLVISEQGRGDTAALPEWVTYTIDYRPGPRRTVLSEHHAAFYSGERENEFHIVDIGSGALPIPTWNTRGVFSRVVLHSDAPRDPPETTFLFGMVATPSPQHRAQIFDIDAYKRLAREELDKEYLLSPKSVRRAFTRAGQSLAGNSYIIVCEEENGEYNTANVYFGKSPVPSSPTNGQEVCEALDQITPIN